MKQFLLNSTCCFSNGKKGLMMLLIAMFSSAFAFAQSAGFNTTYAVLSINGGANAYYDLQATTANPDFNGANLGNFNSSNSLLLKGAEHNVYKCGGCDLTSTRIYYRVYLTGSTPGAFSNLNIGYASGGANGCGGEDQQWANTGYSTNILSGLPAGNYTFEVYSDASVTCSGGTVYASNAGANYKATFNYCGSATGALTPGNYAIPGCFATVAAAVTYLNTNGVTGTGTVQFDVAAGHTETAPAGGILLLGSGAAGNLATGTATNQIIFKKNGAGANPTITMPTPANTAGSLVDGIIRIVGGDYITFDGFTLLENNSNTVITAASNTMTEYGVGIFSATTTNGAQNITIKNCTIDLNRTYTNTFGIYSNTTHTYTTISTALTTAAGGENNNLVITGNTITDINQGIVVIGGAAATAQNTGLVIGGGVGLGNSITNYGTAAQASSYNLVSGTMNGVLIRNTKSYDVSYNTIASSNAVTVGTVRGVFVTSFSNAPTGTLVQSINNNNISVRSSNTTGAIQGVIVEGTTGNATTTLNINANDFNTFGHSVASSGVITYISNSMADLNISISNNTFTNMSVNTTGSVTFISNTNTLPATGSKNVNNNSIVTAFSKTGAGGTVFLFVDNGSSPAGTTNTSNNNNFSNITVTGATIIDGFRNTDGGAPTKVVTGNTVSNITGGTGAITALVVSFSATGNVSNNTVSNITSAGQIVGMTSSSGTQDFSNNTIHSLTTTGASIVNGLSITAGTTNNIFRNKIYNLESNNASGTVNGILISGGTTNTIYNNIIGDLRTPASNAANPLNGINITGGTTSNVYHNTVRLAGTSSGALFGSSAISASTTPNVTLRNNIFINNSGFAGTAVAVAYRRSSTTLTTYNAASDNNLFYAGTPSANNVIFFDGTTVRQTLADYKTFVATRDQASQTENVTFQSTTGSNANFLRIAAGTTSYAESGAVLITTPNINTDYWGITRPFPSPTNGGTTPDIGASEFDGIPSLVNCTTPTDSATAFTSGAVTATTAAATFTAATGTPTGYLVVASVGAFSGTPVDGTGYTAGATLGNGTVVQSSSSLSIAATALVSNTTYTFTIISYNSGSCAGGPKYKTDTTLTGTMTTCAGVPTTAVTSAITGTGFTTAWTAPTGGGAFTVTYSVEVTTDAGYTTPIAGSPFATTSVSQAITGLTPQTNYYWRVKANNTVCDSAYLSAGLVTTDCVAITTFPSTEPFATYLPSTCWKEGDLGDLTAGPSLISATASSWDVDGFLNSGTTGAARLNIFSTADSDWLLTPYYTIPATGYRVKYSVGATNFNATSAVTNWETDDFVQLLVSTSTTNWTVLKTYNNTNVPSNLGQIDESDLSAYNGQTVRFAFRGVEGATDGAADLDFFVDNFIVEVIPVAISASATVNPICSGDSTTLSVTSANTNYAYTWSPATGLSGTTGTSVTANPTTTTTYTINAVDGPMVNSTTITVNVNPSPTAITITPASLTVCENDITPLVVTGGNFLNSITSGSGALTTTASSTAAALGPNPLQSYYGGTKQQMLYTAAELSALGFTAGTIINSIAFEMSAVEARTLQNYEVSMQNSALTSFTSTSFVASGFTNVKAAGNVTPVVGVNTISLDSPFSWNGTSSLLIQISFSNNDSGGTGTNTAKYDTTSFPSTLFYRVDSTSASAVASATTASFAAYSSRNKVVFGLLVPTVTWSPQTDLYTDITASTAYTGQNLTTVYHKGTSNQSYIATATLGSCSKTATSAITVDPASVGGSVTGGVASCSGATSGVLTLSGHTGNIVRWESSVSPFTTWTPIANTTTTYTSGALTQTTQFRAVVQSGVCSEANSSPTTVTIATTTWDGTAWDNGTPTATTAAVMSGNYTSSGSINACSLTVTNNAVVVIGSNDTVNLSGALTVDTGSTFTLENNANLMQGGTTNSNSGSVTVKRNSSLLLRQDYTLWSSPVASQNLLAFSPLTLTNRFYTYNTNTNLYVSIASPSTSTFDAAKGYLIRVPNNHPSITPTSFLGQFAGVPNNGDYSFTMVDGGSGQRFNAVGNPYPSPLDAVDFVTGNSNITGTLYFWRKTNNAASPSYCTWTTAGFTSNGEAQVFDPNDVIQTGQGFFVEGNGSGTALNFNNTMRIDNHANQFFRDGSIERHRVWLNATNEAGGFAQTLISYMTNATNGVDPLIDGRFINDGEISFSSLINNETYAIQGRALPFETSDVVPMNFKVNTAGNYSIAIDHVDGLFSGDQAIYLRDNMLNTVHDLRAGAYNFASEAGTFASRFDVLYTPTLGVVNPVFNENAVVIYKNQDNDFVINTGAITMKDVQVYDLQGRMLLNVKDVNSNLTTVDGGLSNEVLLVKITSVDGVVVTKKVIR